MRLEYTGLNNHGNELNITLTIPDIIQSKEYSTIDVGLILKRIAMEVLKQNNDPLNKPINIDVNRIDIRSNKAFYTVGDEKGKPIHQLALLLNQTDTRLAINEIAKKHLLAKNITQQEVGFESIIERFAPPALTLKPKPLGWLDCLVKAISDFFSPLREIFNRLDRWWEGITGQNEKSLKKDFSVLSDICGTLLVGKVSLGQSLKYMSVMLDKERPETANPILNKRIKDAVGLSDHIAALQNKFKMSGFKKIVSEIRKSIIDIGDKKVLIPVGYKENGQMVEMLLEITKQNNGKYTVTLISESQETRDLFDREVGLHIGHQSMRREITNIDENDLLAKIPILIELETSFNCLKINNTSEWRRIFIQTLRFDHSFVQPGRITESYRKVTTFGHLTETITYVKGEQATADQGKRFELAARLYFFLDLAKNKEGMKDKQFWTLIRTTALELASLIEENKRLVKGKEVQGKELTKIYTELRRVLETLDSNLPETIDLKKQVLGCFQGVIQVKEEMPTPLLYAALSEPNVYPKIDPALASLDITNPMQSIIDWGKRCGELIDSKQIEFAAQEAKLIVRMLPPPKDPFWSKLDPVNATKALKSINTIGEAIARSCYGKSRPTLHDIMSVAALNLYGYILAKKCIQDQQILAPFARLAEEALKDIQAARLPIQDYIWLQKFDSIGPGGVSSGQTEALITLMDKSNKAQQSLTPLLQGMINLSQFTSMALGVAKNDSASPLPQGDLVFTLDGMLNATIVGKTGWSASINAKIPTPLKFMAPEYASAITQSITNRYLTEYCALGCIRDNCPNYALVDQKLHRIHPLYMLHNFVDVFCESLVKRGGLHRDEISDLMYIQQTNQSGYHLYKDVHKAQHGYDIADGFNAKDIRIQAQNTFALFLEKPHFFKQPDLRWLFETKVLNNHAFFSFIPANSQDYNEHKPFLLSMLRKLKNEIRVSSAGGDVDTAAYLLFIADELKQQIEISAIKPEEKTELLAILNFDADALMIKWAQELMGKSEEVLKEKQKMVFSLLLNRYYQKFCANSNDPCFKNDKDLEIILCAIGQLESLEKGKAKIDPEVRDRYLTLRSWMVPAIKAQIAREKAPGEFINRILFYLNPFVSSLQLKWDPQDFPVMLALDNEGEFYQFDLFTGLMTFGKTRSEAIPENIKTNENLKHLFGPVLDENWRVYSSSKESGETGISAYMNDKFPNMRIVCKKGVKPGEAIKIIIEQSIKDSKGNPEWFSYVRFREQDRFVGAGDLTATSDIPHHVAALIGDRQCWLNATKDRVHVFEPGRQESYAFLKLETLKPEVDENTKLPKEPLTIISDVNIISEGVHLLNPTTKELEQFNSIEDVRFILATGPDKFATAVNYYRYEIADTGAPLIYDISEQGTTSKAFPGYHLDRFGVRPGNQDPALGVLPLPKSFDGFQLLTKEGDQKVLIPLRQIQQQFNAAGDLLKVSKTAYTTNYAKCPLFDFSLDPETNRLMAKGGDAYAYLAYICFTHNDYDSASYYLNKARASMGYGKNYETIFQLMSEVKDSSPNGDVFRLRFELFRERVMEDSYMHRIRAGKLAEAEGLAIQRTPRLVQISDSYAKYVEGVKIRQAGESGSDPLLDLTPEEEQHVLQLVKELLKNHGPENIYVDEPTLIRAEEVPVQRYLSDVNHDKLGINQAANLLWLYKGNSSDRSILTIKDPLWIATNFVDLFNQLLELDPQSIEFKQIEHQVRMASELPQNGLSTLEISANRSAQHFLLKLISAKSLPPSLLDPTFVGRFKQTLGKNGKLPGIEGPLFLKSRRQGLAVMDILTSDDFFDQSSLIQPERALAKCGQIRTELDKREKSKLPFHKEKAAAGGVAKAAKKFITQWKVKAEKAAKDPKNPVKPNFENDFKQFIMSEVYGSLSTSSLMNMTRIFKMLGPIPTIQPKQSSARVPQRAARPIETYQGKYGHLLNGANPALDISMIEALEKEIQNAPLAAPPKKIMTLPAKSTFILNESAVKDLNKLFTVEKFKGKDISEKVFDDLAKSKEPAFMRVGEQNRKDMQAYKNEHMQVGLEKGSAAELYDSLIEQTLKTEEEKVKLKRDILQFVERFNTPAGILAMRRITGKAVKPSLDFLIGLWRRGEINQPWENNLFKMAGLQEMPQNLLHQLDLSISKYLDLSVKHQHLMRVIDQNKAYINSFDQEGKGDIHLAEGVYDAIQTKRYFTFDYQESPDFRDLLFLEYNQGIVLRNQQVETIREMLSNPNAARQLGMGGGKSKVILPMMAKRKANGNNLVMLMLPEELYETNCKDLDHTNRQLFGQEMFRFDFTRTSDRSVKALQLIYVRMLRTIKDKGFMMTTKRSMLGFRNAYLDLFKKLESLPVYTPEEDRQQLISQIRAMSKIMKIFNDKTDVLADEIDACLDVRKEVNFSLGESKPIDQVKADIGGEFMYLILNAKAGEPLHELVGVLQKNTQAAMSPEKRAGMMGHLAAAYYDKHQDKLKEVTKEAFVGYIMNKETSQNVEDWIFKLKASNNAFFKELTTLKAFTDRGFGNTFGRIGNVNYGRDPISGIWTIPYKASNTPHLGSEFDDEIEQISYTIQDYLQNGVQYKQVYQIVARMRNRALNEMRQGKSDELISILDTAGGKEFQAFLAEIDPENRLGRNINLATVYTPNNIQALVAAINATPMGRVAFCHKQVIRHLKLYPEQINSLSADVTSLVKHFGGFTGTPWNMHTYDDKIDGVKNLGVDGMTWALMLGRDVKIHSFAFDAQKPIESVLLNLEVLGNYQAVIDTGAYLRGSSNQSFIDKGLTLAKEQGKAVAAGIYFDETGKIVKKQDVKDKALPIDVAPASDLMSNLTLYDQAHTVGADIKQGRQAKAIVTIGENTFIRDLFQAVWRLRQLNQEQSVVLAVSDSIKDRILDGKPGELSTEAILKFCLMNEARREADDNFRAEKEKIHGVTKRFIIPELVNAIISNPSNEKIMEMAHQFASQKAGLFTKLRPQEDAYDQYGKMKKLESPADVLAKYKVVEIDKFQKAKAVLELITEKPLSEKVIALVKQNTSSRADRPIDWFPGKIECTSQAGGEVEQESQAEVENELTLAIETESEQETQVVAETIIPISKSGEAGHGEAMPLTTEVISTTVKTGVPPTIKWPCGQLVGDIVPVTTSYVDADLLRNVSLHLDFFDSDIFCSSIFERNFPVKKGARLLPQCAFYSNRKPVKQVLISKCEGRWTMIIPTVHEAHDNCRKFIVEADKNTQAVEVTVSGTKPLILYKTGADRSDNLPFTDKADEEQFYRLYVQAKLFNGEIEFGSNEEKAALKAWLISKGPEKFKAYFEEHILSAKPRRYADAYSKSSLNAIFKELSAASVKAA